MPRSCHGDQHERRGDPVVEAALDVDQPADPRRDGGVNHHACAQGSICWRERRSYQQGEPDAHAMEQSQRQQGSQADCQRQADPEQPHAQAYVRAQVPQPDPGRVREQHKDQRDLRQILHQLM